MKRILIGAVGAGACVLIYFLFTSPVAPLYWQTGSRQMYEFSHANDVSMALPTGDMTTSRQIVSGVINLRVFDAGGKTIRVGIQISPVTVTAGNARVPGLEKLLSTFFLAELTPGGRFLRFHFDPGVSTEDGRNVTSILQSFQCVIRPGRSATWNDTERDGIGEYRSAYTAKKRYVVKRKEEYHRITNPGYSATLNSDIEAAIGENSKLIVHYGKPASWLHTARGVEKIDLSVNDRRVAAFSVISSLKLAAFDPDPALDIWKEDRSFDALAAQWGAGPRRAGSFWKDLETDSLKKKYAGKSFRGLLGNFNVTGKIISWDSITALKEYLLVNPAECGRVSGYLKSGTLNGTQQAALIHVLELVGHDEAQKTLAHIFNDRSHTMMNRMRSIIALSGVASPSDASVENLIALSASRENAGARELSNTALLGIGIISGSQAVSAGDEEADRRRGRINEHLRKELDGSAGDVDKKTAVLAAIGNSRDGAFAETILPAIHDGNARVRASAARAVIEVGDSEARESVVGLLRAEKQGEVKAAILNSLYEKPAMNSAVRVITGSIGDETSPRVRNSMLKYLVKNRDTDPGIKDTLQNLVRTERDAVNRRLIYQGLYSKQK
jgi:hypothetical protein